MINILKQISRDSEGYDVPVEITGSRDDMNRAKAIIDRILNQDSYSQGGDRGFNRREDRGGGYGFGQSSGVTRFNIPKNHVGKVIGKCRTKN